MACDGEVAFGLEVYLTCILLMQLVQFRLTSRQMRVSSDVNR